MLENKIFVYNFQDLKLLEAIETCNNTKGLCAISYSKDSTVLACPDKTKGDVRVSKYEKNHVKVINAHQSAIASLTLTYDGNLLATASDKVS